MAFYKHQYYIKRLVQQYLFFQPSVVKNFTTTIFIQIICCFLERKKESNNFNIWHKQMKCSWRAQLKTIITGNLSLKFRLLQIIKLTTFLSLPLNYKDMFFLDNESVASSLELTMFEWHLKRSCAGLGESCYSDPVGSFKNPVENYPPF